MNQHLIQSFHIIYRMLFNNRSFAIVNNRNIPNNRFGLKRFYPCKKSCLIIAEEPLLLCVWGEGDGGTIPWLILGSFCVWWSQPLNPGRAQHRWRRLAEPSFLLYFVLVFAEYQLFENTELQLYKYTYYLLKHHLGSLCSLQVKESKLWNDYSSGTGQTSWTFLVKSSVFWMAALSVLLFMHWNPPTPGPRVQEQTQVNTSSLGKLCVQN